MEMPLDVHTCTNCDAMYRTFPAYWSMFRCGACYKYSVVEVPTGEYQVVETGNVVADLVACQEYLDTFGLTADESICVILGYTM